MPDLESFSGFDQGGNVMDPAAFERFKERMAQAAAQLKAIKAGEQKQKKKEDELAKLLLKFLQTDEKKDILLLIARLLELNVPASFIVSILLINVEEVRKELGVQLLPAGDFKEEQITVETLPDKYYEGQALPLKVKIAIDAWIQKVANSASEYPHKILATTIDADGLIRLPLIQLMVLCLQDFLNQSQFPNDYGNLKSFVSYILDGIMKKLQEQLKPKNQLREGK